MCSPFSEVSPTWRVEGADLIRPMACPKVADMHEATYVVIYDISNDRERAKVADLLEGYGLRVQESAFECRLRGPQRGRLVGALRSLGLESGHVALYRVSAGSNTERIGVLQADPQAESNHVVIL